MSEPVATEVELPITWPNPLVENFDSNWPNLELPDADVENELLEHKQLLLRTVTWNLCAKPPPAVDQVTRTLLPKNRFHLYFIGSEECERSIAQSAINPSKKNWELYLCEALGDRYVPVRSHTLQAIHLMAFAHKSIAHLCSFVTSAAVATGAGNTMGNKGGVAVYLRFGDLKILVVNAHLAAHQNAERQRNADFQKINRGIPALIDKKSAVFNIPKLASITEDKIAASTQVPSIDPTVENNNVNIMNNTTDSNNEVNSKLAPLIPPPISVSDSNIDSTLGLALITTPAMRKVSIQVIGNEVDGEGPVKDIDGSVLINDNIVTVPTSATAAATEEPLVIIGAAPGTLNGPSEVVVQPVMPVEEDPGDEDDGDPEDAAGTLEDGNGNASIATDDIANAVTLEKTTVSPRPRSNSTELLSDGGGIAAEKTLDQCADVVIFMGDLNYRIKGNRSIVSRLLQTNMHDVLLNNDQLRANMNKALVLKNFTEPPLNFRPTYKLDVGSVDTYDTGPKHRIPAWADRILYVHNPQYLNCIAYNSDPAITTSDHKPIYASFVIQLESYVTIDSQQNIIGKRLSPKFTSESQVCSIM